MPKHKGRLAIVGLGAMGQSLGLALRARAPDVEVIGHDREPEAARAAQQRRAVHRTHWNLISTVEGASLVILALPTDECLATLEALKGDLSAGTVVTDTAPLKAPLARWAASEMASDAHYVGGHPLARPATPDGDALLGSTYCLTPSPGASPAAVNAVVGLVERIGAHPAFLDPGEHDSLMWALQGTPALAAAVALGRLCDGLSQADVGWLAEALPEETIRLARLGESFLGGIVSAADAEPGRRSLTDFLEDLKRLVDEIEGGAAAAAAARLRQQRELWLARPSHDDEPTHPGTNADWRRILGLR
ncbi:MAG: prephenate dehydrogenase [Anaerolineae bacterium]|nr:prephenate dehydrogenase [Anaerolineae bacterium]